MKVFLPKHRISLFAAIMLLVQLTGLQVQSAYGDTGKAVQQSPKAAPTTESRPGQTPIMGWSSWNAFRIHINEQLIREQADALVSSGLKDAGYSYVNLDDGYVGGRNQNGVLQPNSKFPSGMKALADYIHSKGLKAGIYTDAGTVRCASIYDNDPNFPEGGGSYGYRQTDFETFVDTWGYDFVKVDWCGGQRQNLDPQTEYTNIKRILDTLSKDVIYEVCNWAFPGAWVTDIASQWRVSGDIAPNFNSITHIIDLNANLAKYAGPGHFNHMDMLQVGNGMTYEEDKSHFSMWAIMASPLIAGNDLRTMSEKTKSILTNKEVIAVNQDPLGIQGTRAVKNGNQEVWMKQLQDPTTKAVALFNRGNSAAQMKVDWKDVGINGSASVRDLWEHKDKGVFDESYSVTVPAHGIVMLKIKANSSIETDSIAYNKNAQSDIKVNMVDNVNTFVAIKNGDQTLVSGRDYEISGKQLTIKKSYLLALPEGKIKLQIQYTNDWSQYISIDVYGEPLTYYLSDLPWVSATSGWQSVKRDQGHEGYDLKLNDIVYKKGLWANSKSTIVYNLDRPYKTFKAIVGNDDFRGNPPGVGTISFEVWTDGTKQFDSGLMKSTDNKTQEVNVSVEGVKELKLVINDGGDNNWFDRAIWADAKLIEEEATMTPQTTLTGPSSVASEQPITAYYGLKGLSQSIYAQDIRIAYDADRFEFISAASVVDGIGILETVQEDGKIRLIVANQGADPVITGDMKVLELTFKAKTVTQQETGSIAVSEAIVADDQGVETSVAGVTIAIDIEATEPGISGDINGDGTVSIGDLAIVAAKYGKTSSDPDWAQHKHADINKDGKIDIMDLAEIARQILQ